MKRLKTDLNSGPFYLIGTTLWVISFYISWKAACCRYQWHETITNKHSVIIGTHTHTYFLCSVDQTSIRLLNESHTPYCPCNYRFLSGLASIISQRLLQVEQLLYYCNHGDLFAVRFSSWNVFLDEWAEDLRVCVCQGLDQNTHEPWPLTIIQINIYVEFMQNLQCDV